jgi:hypothetical protein
VIPAIGQQNAAYIQEQRRDRGRGSHGITC